MGRAARWFKALFGIKRSKETQNRVSGDCSLPAEPVFLKDTDKEQNKQAIAFATATASAAETAVAEAKAAATAAVVRLTSSEGRSSGDMDRWAAVKIQKVFRGSLARKALRALKGIVKLQALVRGYLVRKRAAAMLQSIQTLMRVQTAMRSKRINRCLNKEYNNNNIFQPRQSIDKFYEERNPKIVEIDDTYSRRSKSRQVLNNVVAMPEPEYGNDLELSFSEEKWKYATAHSTPRFSSSSHHNYAVNNNNNRYYVMRSPAKSVCGNVLCDYGNVLSTPGYMEKTKSFKAKVRSQSAPRQRSERKRLSLDEIMASRSSVSGANMVQQQRNSCSYDRF